MAKISTYASATPALADLIYFVDDPAGTPVGKQNALSTLRDLFEANLTAPVVTATWNNAGTTFFGAKINITNTASAAASQLLELQTAGTKQFAVSPTGVITGTGQIIFDSATHYLGSTVNNTRVAIVGAGIVRLYSAGSIQFHSGTNLNSGSSDVGLNRTAAGIMRVTNASTGGGTLEFIEQTAPAAGAANTVRLYAQDNGAGKTQLMALFNSGAAQQVAIEP